MHSFYQVRTLLLALFLAAQVACVSSSTHKKLQDEYQATLNERDQLRAEKQTSENKVRENEIIIGQLQSKYGEASQDKSRLESSIQEMKNALNEMNKRKMESERRIAEYRDLTRKFKSMIDTNKLRVKIVEGRMVVEMATDVLFNSGSAQLSAEGKSAVAEASKLLAAIPNRKFQVEGHTDNMPINTIQFPSNWELASARALTVMKTMGAAGMPLDRMSASSSGDTRPAQPNDTKEGRAANRRIEIVVLPDLSTLPGFEELNRMADGPEQKN